MRGLALLSLLVASVVHAQSPSVTMVNGKAAMNVVCLGGTCSGGGGGGGGGVVSDGSTAGDADVVNAAPTTGLYGLVVRPLNRADGTPGSAVPSIGLFTGGTDGTNFRAFKVDANGELQVDILNSTLAVTQSGTWALNHTAVGTALAVRCVSTDGSTFEACGGSGGGGLTDAQLRASAVPVSLSSTTITGSVAVTGPLTDAQLRATAVPVSGTFWQATQPVSGSVTASISQSGTANDVDLASSLPAGTNNIGDVDVLTLPALPTGTNNIGDVDLASAIPAGNNNIGDVDVASLPALAAGTNNIGDVDVLTEPGVGSVASTAPTSARLVGGRAVADAASPTARTAGQLADLITALDGRLHVQTRHPNWFHCQLTTTATTATQLTAGDNCPGTLAGSNKYHIESFQMTSSAASTTTTNEQLQIITGTGTNCGTSTRTSTVCMTAANGGCNSPDNFYSESPAAGQLCIRAAMAGTKTITVMGYVGP